MPDPTERDPLLRAVRDDPDDDAPRLVFADWLDEHGQADWADFIRRDVRLARLPEGHPDRAALAHRRATDHSRFHTAWAGIDARLASHLKPCLERGFVESLWWEEAALSHWSEVARLVRGHPVRDLAVFGPDPYPGRSDGCPLDLVGLADRMVADLDRTCLARLFLRNVGGDLDAGLGRLGEARALSRLRRLHLDLDVTESAMTRLVRGRLGGTLTEVRVRLADDGPGACAALAGSSLAGRLAGLELGDGLTDEGLGAALGGRVGRALKELTLSANDLTPGAADVLARWNGRLDGFTLGDGLPDDALADILSAPAVATATRLELAFREEDPCRAAVAALADPRRPAPVRDLTFVQVPVDDDRFARLLLAPTMAGLERLSVLGAHYAPDRRLTDAGATAIAAAPHARALRHLTLHAQDVGPAGAAALAGSPQLAELRELDLLGCPVGDAGAVALTGATFADRLTFLDLYDTGIGDDGALTLATAFPRLERLYLSAEALGPAARSVLSARFGAALTLW